MNDLPGSSGALVGAVLALLSGGFSLALKKRLPAATLQSELKVLGIVFAVRLALLGGGLLWVVREDVPPVLFTVGFFSVYFVLQWLELRYVLAGQKRLGNSR